MMKKGEQGEQGELSPEKQEVRRGTKGGSLGNNYPNKMRVRPTGMLSEKQNHLIWETYRLR
jgi:hypothetical protein